jgi:N-acetylmuramoyl-L-alanine amidase
VIGAQFTRFSVLIPGLILVFQACAAYGADMVRVELEKGATAVITDGRIIALEVAIPDGASAEKFLVKYLGDVSSWRAYRNLKSAGIPYSRLNPAAQRKVLEALFPDDYADEEGWWHTVTYRGRKGAETLFSIAEWLTGKGTNYKEILSIAENSAISEQLRQGDVILIPHALLLEVMTTPTPGRAGKARPVPKPNGADLDGSTPVDGAEDLTYGEDKEGKYAEYRLKRGETIYSNVIVRFTDMSENADIQDACEVVLKRSGLKNAAALKEGQRVRIPLDLLSNAYQPSGSVQRREYDEVREQAKKLNKGGKEGAKGLKGVVIILDAGHGGRDKGAMNVKAGLYEDELTYDIVARLKLALETKTQAKVHVTVKDPDQAFLPTGAKKFVPDDDEFLLTTPPYPNDDARISASLRWYLANDIYRKALKAGTKEDRALFLSVHCDSIFNSTLRGAMIYVPGAAYRKSEETADGEIYDRFAEARAQRTVKTTAKQRQRDEVLSYNFASTVISTLNATKKPAIKVHGPGDPIRNVIRQKGGKVYVPAVLRNCMVPTKVLLETANLTNASDCANLADPAWRQAFADALLKAITKHFGG